MPSLENKVVTHITLYADASTQNKPPYIYAKQYDANSRYIVVKIVDANKNIPITGAAQLNATKPDGTHSYIAGTVNKDGTVTIGLTSNLLAADGKISCDITVFDSANSGGVMLTTSTFFILVDKSNYDSDAIESTNEFLTVSDALNKIAADRAASEAARDEAVAAAEEVQTTLAIKADGLVLEGSRLYLTSAGKEIGGSSVEIVTGLTEVFEEIDKKADGFVIEDSKLYLTSEGSKITEGISITTDLTAVYSAITRKADGLILDGNKLQLVSGETPLGAAIELPTGVSGLAVENEKLYLLTDDGGHIGEGVSLPQHIDGLVTQVDGDNTKLYLSKDGEPLGTGIILPKGGGGSAGSSTITIERITPTPLIITPDKSQNVDIEFNFEALDSDGQQLNGDYTWMAGSKILERGTLSQGYNCFETKKLLGQSLPIGTTRLTLTVNDEAGGTITRVWSIQVVDIRIVPSSTNLAKKTYAVGENISFNYIPYGAVEKTIHFKIDGTEIGTIKTSASGNSQKYTIPAQTHGAHLFECYITASISGVYTETEHLYYDLIWFDEDVGTPIIGCAYRNDLRGNIPLKQFSTAIIPFYVVDSNTSTPMITKEIDGVVVSEETLTNSEGEWSVKLTEVGEHTLIIRCGVASVEIVIDTTSVGFNVETVEGYIFDFNPIGRTNSSTNRLWTEKSNPDIRMSVSSNFDWQNGGYQIGRDENGNAIPGEEYFCIKSGTYAAINYNMFAKDAKENGAAFKVVFKTTNVCKSDAQFLVCSNGSSDDRVGLIMNVHEAYIRTSAGELYVPYSEEDTIEFEYNIYPIGEGKDATSHIMTYEDGVGLRPLIYNNEHVIKQYSPSEIIIGSPDCDVYIYRMRAYEISLTDSDILQNFITDARTSDEMISRHDRNQIYDENGNLTPELLAQKCPDLRIIKVEAPWFTNDKDNKVDGTTVQMIYKNGDPVLDNWTCTNALHSGQGTSSNEYGYAGRNLDLIMDGDNSLFTFSDGTTGKTITLTRNSVPTDYLNVKVNIASSENANNALMANRYNAFNPYKRTAKNTDSKVKDCMEFYNCVVFIKETDEDLSTHREFNDTNWHFYAFGNVGDSKKTDDTRVDDKNDPKECVIEIADYNVRLAEFPTGNGSDICAPANWKAGNTAYDDLYAEYKYKEGKFKSFGNGSYEFRYEKKGITDEERQVNIDAWRNFYRFVVTSTDKEFHDNLKDYFVVESALYYYLFTERYTMVDNRAKNSFWHYGKGADGVYRWDLTFGYDFDTSLGIDNTGKLVLPYGKEDVDYYVDGDSSSSYIYRAAESTFFCRIRDLFKTELEAMYLNRENVNAWSANGLIAQWDNSQNQFPEELWRIDIERKYLRTYKGISIDNSKAGAANPRFFGEMMNGRKRYQRRQFERNQEIYFATKYFGKMATADQIMMRFNNPVGAAVAKDFTLRLTPYSDMYIGYSFYNGHKDNFRAKAGVEYTINYPEGLQSADITLIYGASFIQGIGDLSRCYVGDNDFSKASRLRSLVIGSSVAGYTNTFMTTLSLGNNKLLEYLDIRNMASLNSIVDLTKCYNLIELYAEGSSISGVAFAKNGKVTTAHLPDTINTLRMQNLQNLTDFQMPTGRLQRLIIEHCLIDEKTMVQESVDTLQELTLAGINWTGDNALATTELLNAILNITESYLSGQVYINGQARSSELDNYENAWSDLDVTCGTFIEEFPVTFKNEDGTILDVQWVARGGNPVNPINRADNPISTPTKSPAPDKLFTYNGWSETKYFATDDGGEGSGVYGAITIIATYAESTRYYTVKWFVDGELKYEDNRVEYLCGTEYPGELPTKADNAEYGIYYLFAGWDGNTYRVYSDMNVNAIFVEGRVPMAVSPKPALASRTIQEINAICKAGQKDWERKYMDGYLSDFEQQYFELGDTIDVTLGWEPNDAESNSHLIFDLGTSESVLHYNKDDEGTVCNGVSLPITFNQIEGDPLYLDTGVKLMDNSGTAFGEGDDYEFTFVVDFAGNDITTINGNIMESHLLDCHDSQTNSGIKIFQNSNGSISMNYAGVRTISVADSRLLSAGSYYFVTDPENKVYDPSSTPEMKASWLDRVVVRKKKGERGLTVYRSNPKGLDYKYDTLNYSDGALRPAHSGALWLGCGRNAYGAINQHTASNCTIYNFKVWDIALSDLEMEKMSVMPNEKIAVNVQAFPRTTYGVNAKDNYLIKKGELIASNRYSANVYPGISMGMVNLMRNSGAIEATDTNSVSWKDSDMCKWLNGRFYKALPQLWQSAIKNVKVLTSAGGGGNPAPDSAYEIVKSEHNIFLLSLREYSGSGDNPYDLEGSPLDIYTDNTSRMKHQVYGHKMAQLHYWTRSPYILSNNKYCLIGSVGSGASVSNLASRQYGVSASFCI